MRLFLCGILATLPWLASGQAKPLPNGRGAGYDLGMYAKNAHLVLARVIVHPTARNRPLFLALTERLAEGSPKAAVERTRLRKALSDLIGAADEHRIVGYGVVQTPIQTPLEDVRIDVVLSTKGKANRRLTFVWATAPQAGKSRLLRWVPTPG